MKKIVMILAIIAILSGVGLTIEKTKDEARIPVGGATTAYIPSVDTVAYVTDQGATVSSIPVGGT